MLASSVCRVSVAGNRTQYESFELRPFTPHIGAEIRGLDVSKPLSDAQAIELDQAFAEWMVLAIRDQHLTRDQHEAFGRRFGKLHVHPMHAAGLRGADPEILPVKTDANVAYTAGDGWHTDVTCDEIPPLASMLYVTGTPECGGGDTSYAAKLLKIPTR
jgi:taurine dioxygenase